MARSTRPRRPPWTTARRSAKTCWIRREHAVGQVLAGDTGGDGECGERRDQRRGSPPDHQPTEHGEGGAEGVRPEEQPPEADHLEGHEPGPRPPPRVDRFGGQSAGCPHRPAAAPDDLADTVVGAPEHEGPGGAVPEAAEEHGDEDVDRDPPLAPAVATERNVEIVAQPERERDVPAPPEVLEVERGVRPPEVDREPEAEQQGDADGHVGVPAEVRVDLDGVPPDGEEDLEGGVLVGVGEDRVDHIGRQVRREHHLLGQAGDDQPAGLRRAGRRWDRASSGSAGAARFPGRSARPPDGGRTRGRP